MAAVIGIKTSIARKLLTLVFSFYLFITVTVTLMHMYFDFANAQERVAAELVFQASMVSTPLSESLWNYNSEAIRSVTAGLSKSPSILGIKVVDDNGKSWKAGYVPSDSSTNFDYYDTKTGKKDKNKKRMITRPFDWTEDLFHTDATGNKLKIGQVIIYSSSDVVFDEVKAIFVVILLNAFLKTGSLWILFLVLGYKYLTKPLTALTNAAREVKNGNLNPALLIQDMKWPTEIDVLSSNFDSMTTDLRLATAKIVSSQQRLREIIDSMPSMIFGANKKGELTEWNKEIAHYMKIDREQVMNKTFVALCPNYAFLMPVIEKVLVSKIPERLPNQVVYINEHRSHQDIIIYPIISQEEIAIIVRIDDVTDKINLERAMIQTEKMSSVGTLASGMAHEINGPLSIILQGIQNIERRIDPAIEANQKTAQELGIDLQHVYKYFEYRKLSMFINGMKEAAERASKTVANLVEFSRESNSVKASCSLVEIVEHALILLSTDYDFKNLTEHHQLKIVKNIEENLPNIYASSSDIQQVIFTLLKHALHSMQNQDKNALINIKLSQIDSMIELQIENNGAHLDDETQKRIFEPFFTPKNLSESKKIGLSVSYKIITQGNKGELSLVSKENEGTVFILKLPLATAS